MQTGNEAQALVEKHRHFWVASARFWLINGLGWLTFASAEGIRHSFDGSPLTENLIQYLPTSLFGMLSGWLVRYLYATRDWHLRHPLQMIPIACGIAVAFGLLNTTVHYSDLVIAIPEICSRHYPRPPYTCGMLSDLFLQSMGAMQLWCLFFFLIQAERKLVGRPGYSSTDVVVAIAGTLFLSYLGTHLSVVAWVDWGDTHYLFSHAYAINALTLLIPLISTSYILFIRPQSEAFGSPTIPLIPLLLVTVFCCVALNIGAGGVLSRLDNLPDNWTLRYLLVGEVYGNFSQPALLAGVLDGSFVSTLSMTLFYLLYRFKPINHKSTLRHLSFDNVRHFLVPWSYYCLYWLTFGLLIYATDIMNWAYVGHSVPATNTIAFIVSGVCIGAVLRMQMLYFADQSFSLPRLALIITTASVFAGALLSSAIWLVSYIYIFVVLDGEGIAKYSSFVAVENVVLANILANCVLCGLWSFICYLIESMRLQRLATLKQLELEKNMKDIQLNTLAGKLDPHFIFNALNNIRTLINEDSERARDSISVLSDLLRSPMTASLQDKVTVDDELTLVSQYIALSKIQLEERLIYQEEIEESARGALIPTMLLQILVENAIKHGISQLPDGGTLTVKIRQSEATLTCEVINHGSLRESGITHGFGIGVTAVQERLALLYSGNARFTLEDANNTVVATLTLPFERNR